MQFPPFALGKNKSEHKALQLLKVWLYISSSFLFVLKGIF